MYRLARLAGIRHKDAVSTVEMLHHWAQRYVLRGDVGRHDDAEIAAAVEWEASDGTPEQIVSALVGAGWLDIHQVHRLVVHDWWDHCDPFVHMALARAKAAPFACGRAPKRTRISGDERKELDAFWTAYEQKVAGSPPGGIQPELIPSDEIRAHAVRTPCALPTPTPSPTPSPDPERESDARARGFGPGEETSAPDRLGEGERAAVSAWATLRAPSRKDRAVELEEACLLHARSHGKTSSDWVSEVKLWILREGEFEKPPPQSARPSLDARAVSRERSERAERDAERRQKQLDEWQREKDEAEPGAISEAREDFRRRIYLNRNTGAISLDAWVDRKAASG